MSVSYYRLPPGASAIFDCNDMRPYDVLDADGNWKPANFLNETSRFVVPMTSKSKLNNLEVFKAEHSKNYPYDIQICIRGENEIGAFRRRHK